MAGRKVEQWPADAYRHALRLETGGQAAETHLALFQPPDGRRCRGFVKHFVGPETVKCLFNEWFCFHVLEAVGVPQPRCAIVRAPRWSSHVLEPAFVSCEPSPVNHGTPKQRYNPADLLQLRELARRLLGCYQLPSVIAADQLIANGDRNMGNLVFTGESTLVAIDHSHALHGPSWVWGDHWRTQQRVGSKVIDLLRHVLGGVPLNTANAIVAASEATQERYYETQDYLREVLSCRQDQDAHTAMDMTWWRCDKLADWVRLELGVI